MLESAQASVTVLHICQSIHSICDAPQCSDAAASSPTTSREGRSPADGKSSEDKADEATTKDRKQNDSRGEKV